MLAEQQLKLQSQHQVNRHQSVLISAARSLKREIQVHIDFIAPFIPEPWRIIRSARPTQATVLDGSPTVQEYTDGMRYRPSKLASEVGYGK